MSELETKFLNEQGVRYLWRQIKQEQNSSNETLSSNIAVNKENIDKLGQKVDEQKEELQGNIDGLKQGDIDSLKTDKVPFPKTDEDIVHGEENDMLSSNGDGSTSWKKISDYVSIVPKIDSNDSTEIAEIKIGNKTEHVYVPKKNSGKLTIHTSLNEVVEFDGSENVEAAIDVKEVIQNTKYLPRYHSIDVNLMTAEWESGENNAYSITKDGFSGLDSNTDFTVYLSDDNKTSADLFIYDLITNVESLDGGKIKITCSRKPSSDIKVTVRYITIETI